MSACAQMLDASRRMHESPSVSSISHPLSGLFQIYEASLTYWLEIHSDCKAVWPAGI